MSGPVSLCACALVGSGVCPVTRQRLNSIEASSRAKVNFLEQLYRFHKQQGNPRVSVPTINHKPLDLWTLRKEVHRLGGYEAVWFLSAVEII